MMTGPGDFDDDEKTDPFAYAELTLYFDGVTRTYHNPARCMPDAVEIGSVVLQTAQALYGPDARAIEAAGLGPQLHRLLGMIAAATGLAVSRTIKDVLHGRPN